MCICIHCHSRNVSIARCIKNTGHADQRTSAPCCRYGSGIELRTGDGLATVDRCVYCTHVDQFYVAAELLYHGASGIGIASGGIVPSASELQSRGICHFKYSGHFHGCHGKHVVADGDVGRTCVGLVALTQHCDSVAGHIGHTHDFVHIGSVGFDDDIGTIGDAGSHSVGHVHSGGGSAGDIGRGHSGSTGARIANDQHIVTGSEASGVAHSEGAFS